MHGLAAFALLALQPVPPAAQEWSRFRGPNGSGVSAARNLPEAIGPQQNVRWRRPFSAGHSSPVLGNDAVFLTAADEEGLTVAAVVQATGELRWQRRLERAHRQEVFPANGSATPSPVTDGSNVYVFFPELGLAAFNAAGEDRWRLPLGPFHSFYGMAASPVLAGDTLVLLCDQQQGSFLLGVETATGKEKWRTARTGQIESWTTPVLYPSAEPRSLLAFGTFRAASYALATGVEEWSVGSLGYTPVCSPVLWERPEGARLFTSVPFHAEGGAMQGFAAMSAQFDKDQDARLTKAELAGSGYDEHFGWADADRDGTITEPEWTFIAEGMSSRDYGLVAFALGEKAPKELWRAKRGLPAIATPLLLDGLLYLVKSGGMLTLLDAESGEEVAFQRLEGGGEYDASPVAGEGKVYLASQEGRLTVLAAGPEPKVLSTSELGEVIHATPAIGPGALYVRSEAALYCFGKPD